MKTQDTTPGHRPADSVVIAVCAVIFAAAVTLDVNRFVEWLASKLF